jgi:hypothetical protein
MVLPSSSNQRRVRISYDLSGVRSLSTRSLPPSQVQVSKKVDFASVVATAGPPIMKLKLESMGPPEHSSYDCTNTRQNAGQAVYGPTFPWHTVVSQHNALHQTNNVS